LGDGALDTARELAHETGQDVWDKLKVPVYFYGHGEGRSLADIRAGRARPDVGGPDLHPTAGAVCVGARQTLVAFNVMLFDMELVAARALARSIPKSCAGLRAEHAASIDLPRFMS